MSVMERDRLQYTALTLKFSRFLGGLNGLTHVKHLEQYLGLEVFVGVVKVAREPSLVFRMD